ncbi:MAG: hypothetical protein DRJ45_02925, partial [Thermoprotei archaeon]
MRIKNVSIFIFIIAGVLNAYEPQKDVPKVYLDLSKAEGTSIIKRGAEILESENLIELTSKNLAEWLIVWEKYSTKYMREFDLVIWGNKVNYYENIFWLQGTEWWYGWDNEVTCTLLGTDKSMKFKVKIVTHIKDDKERVLDSRTDEENAKGVAIFIKELLDVIGRLKWKFKTGASIRWGVCPAVTEDGRIYCGSDDDYLYCLDMNGNLIWKYKTGGNIPCAPLIVGERVIFGSKDGYLYCLNRNTGSLLWRYKTEGDFGGTSPAYNGEHIITGVGKNNPNLYCFDLEGNEIWRFSIGTPQFFSAAIGPDGIIYVGSDESHLYAISSNGTIKWDFNTETIIKGYLGVIIQNITPEIKKTIGLRENYGVLITDVKKGSPAEKAGIKPNDVILEYDGKKVKNVQDICMMVRETEPGKRVKILLWRKSRKITIHAKIGRVGAEFYGGPAISSDGTVYASSDEGYLYSINPDGSLKWKFKTGDDIWSSPAIAKDGTIYVGSLDGYLYAINPDGSLKWKFKTGGSVVSSPAIAQDGTIYVGSDDCCLYAINPDGLLKWKFKTGGWVCSSPTIGPDGTVYFGSNDGYLYAIYDDNGGLADSPWPKFRHDLLNTGNFTFSPGAVVEISTIEPPFLEIKSFEVIDEDGDGVFSAGEDAYVKVKIENSGKGDANNVKLKLSGFVERSIGIGEIRKGETVSKEVYFRVPLGVETAKESIKLFVDAGDYSPEPITISLYTQAPIPPVFSVSVKVDDDKTGLSVGDGDGKIEPRETIELHVKIRNTGKGDANGVAVEVLPKDERIKIVKSRDELGDLPSGAEVDGVVAFFVPSGYPENKVPVEIKITENTGLWTVAKVLKFDVGKVSSRKYEIKPEGVIAEGGEFTTTVTVEEKEGEEKGLPEHPIFQNPNRIALVIGVGDYDKLPKLPCSINDARLMKEIVKKLMGVKDENLKYLENPSLAEMRKGIRWLVTKAMARKHPEVIVYYSGHGTTDDTGEP